MPGPTLSTGGISLNDGHNQPSGNNAPIPRSSSDPFHLLILGRFSGDNPDRKQIAPGKRKMIEVDRDNFDEVFASLNVTLDIQLLDKPVAFTEMDELHPDYLYDNIPLFDRFHSLKRRLKNPDTFAAAAAEISGAEPPDSTAEAKADSGQGADSGSGASLLDALLQSPENRVDAAMRNGEIDVRRLVRDIFAPYVTQRDDPRQQEYMDAADNAAADLMRQIMHHSGFQQLEATWRGLYQLVRNTETDTRLKIYLVDVSLEELIADSLSDDPGQAIRTLLCDRRRSRDDTPFSLVLADYQFRDLPVHAATLAQLAAAGEQLGAPVIASGHEQIAGCRSLAATPDPDDWDYRPDEDFLEIWKSVRQTRAAQYLALTCPRFMVRLPYGRKTSPADKLSYEELEADNSHEYYCWANSVWLAGQLLARHVSEYGATFTPGRIQAIERLPLHTYTDEDGDPAVKPCAEIQMTDSVATRLLNAGLLPVRSVRNHNGVLIPAYPSVHQDQAPLTGRWS